jgi:hypothetical protein
LSVPCLFFYLWEQLFCLSRLFIKCLCIEQ